MNKKLEAEISLMRNEMKQRDNKIETLENQIKEKESLLVKIRRTRSKWDQFLRFRTV